MAGAALTRRAFSAAALAGVAAATAAERRTNFLVLLADDLGWSDLPCYGNRLVDTPNIDRLAAEGVLFRQAYAAGPVCSPTRASLQTGLYPARIGMFDIANPHRRPWAKLIPPPNLWELPAATPTVAEILTRAGYRCANIGKWHLGETPETSPEARGYMRLPDYHPSGARVAAFAAANPEAGAGHQTAQAIGFLEAHRDQPFFCFVSYNLPHVPMRTRADLRDKYLRRAQTQKTDMHPEYAGMVEVLDECRGFTGAPG